MILPLGDFAPSARSGAKVSRAAESVACKLQVVYRLGLRCLVALATFFGRCLLECMRCFSRVRRARFFAGDRRAERKVCGDNKLRRFSPQGDAGGQKKKCAVQSTTFEKNESVRSSSQPQGIGCVWTHREPAVSPSDTFAWQRNRVGVCVTTRVLEAPMRQVGGASRRTLPENKLTASVVRWLVGRREW
ncbi:hypothetical protein Enr8_50750 [Blastopirellula retiformator]|uniref:Uncharacterized protein n=1 Tax=Blastopirellula retiformator TaxID=2527970 RepID=A0A5C5USC3_9BACT|nr:hypothetical protein Enr8_50750 [Blastopirellula retiformator]